MRRAAAALLVTLLAAPAAGQVRETTAACPSGSAYCPSGLPDRIVLTPGANPARAMAVAWRTDARQDEAVLELVRATGNPDMEHGASRIAGSSRPLETENGRAVHHQARIDGLEPDTSYAYRVRAAAGWSEWFQFRTPAETFRPFSILYFGDQQNDILEVGARTVRQAFRALGDPALVLHAGDLVQQRDGGVHDDEWGEWAAAGGDRYAAIPQVPAAGNHEYIEATDAFGERSDYLGPHWPLAFALPGNGAPGAGATTYHIDYQGVRVVVLDGTSARDMGTLEAQAEWLNQVLSEGEPRWRVVLLHQPLFSCARPNDPRDLNRVLRPILERHGVDLVLQGHDHCYSRITDPEGGRDAPWPRSGPVYLTSVAGGKMYALNDRASARADRVAEDTQLYQTITFGERELVYRAYTSTGELYDALSIEISGQVKRIHQPSSSQS